MKMKKIIALILGAFALYSCVDDNYHDSGLANGRYDGTVWEYMHSNHEWDSALVVIERAGLVGIFDGSDPAYKDGITFLALRTSRYGSSWLIPNRADNANTNVSRTSLSNCAVRWCWIT